MFLTLLGPRIWSACYLMCPDGILTVSIGWVRWSAVWSLKNILGDDLMAKLIASSRYKDAREFKEWEAHKDAYIREFYEQVIPFVHGDGVRPADGLT